MPAHAPAGDDSLARAWFALCDLIRPPLVSLVAYPMLAVCEWLERTLIPEPKDLPREQ